MDNLEAQNTICPTIGIMPSGFSWGVRSSDKKDASLGSSLLVGPRSKGSTNGRIHGNQIELKEELLSPKMLHHCIYSVPYSDHSCFSELQDFVKLICPAKISGTVSSSFCYINSHFYFRDLSGDCQQPGWSSKKFRGSEPSESAEIMPTSVLGRSKFNESKRHEDKTIACLRMHRNQVCILRRQRHGTRIAEPDRVLKSVSNVKTA